MYARSQCLLLGVLAVASLSAGADVTIEERVDVGAIGGFSMAAMEGKSVTRVSGDKARTDSDMQFKSKFMRAFSGPPGGSAQIVRLDQQKIYEVDIGGKQYTEMSFAEMRQATQQAMQQAEQAMQQQSGAGAPGAAAMPVDEQRCEWSEPRTDVRRTGERATIAGVAAEQAVVSVARTCRDRETGKACDIMFDMEQWLAPDAPGGPELRQFWMNYARSLGFDETTARSMKARYQQLLGQYDSVWKDVAARAGELEGYPLKSVITLRMGGPECTTDDGQPLSDSMFGDATAAGLDAGTASAASAAGSIAAQEAAKQAGSGLGGSIAGSAAGAFTGKLASSLMEKMKKQKEQVAQPEPEAPASGPGSVTLFRIVTETTSISPSAVPADAFEVPAGFRKIANPALGTN
jgi:hypothetical protein